MMFLIWVPVLLYVITQVEDRWTRNFLIVALLLNLAAFIMAYADGDFGKFLAFEHWWNQGEPPYHAD